MEKSQIEGRRLDRPVQDLEQDFWQLIQDEWYSDNPDNVLIDILADGMLLCREYEDLCQQQHKEA